MKIERLRRYGKEYGGDRLSAFFGLHRFEYGGKVSYSLHLWPFYIQF